MTRYYKKIRGKNYDRHLLELAEELMENRKRGMLTKEDALEIYKALSDANKYTDVEKRTMRYIREHYRFTEAADALLRKKVRIWAAKKGWERRRKR